MYYCFITNITSYIALKELSKGYSQGVKPLKNQNSKTSFHFIKSYFEAQRNFDGTRFYDLTGTA